MLHQLFAQKAEHIGDISQIILQNGGLNLNMMGLLNHDFIAFITAAKLQIDSGEQGDGYPCKK